MDAQLNDLIRLKQPPSAPIQRWQVLPGRSNPRQANVSPLRVRTNVQHAPTSTSKTPISYKKSPKVSHGASSRTPSKTPGRSSSKTPSSKRRTPGLKATGKTRTPGRTGHTPASCRFIPNRSTTDLEYSSYLVTSQTRPGRAAKDEEEEEEEEVVETPSREDYLHALRQAASGGRSQKGVLSFRATSSFIDSEYSVSPYFHFFLSSSLTLPSFPRAPST